MKTVSRIGFTGTRSGMSKYQRVNVKMILSILSNHMDITAIHGGCVGADEEFHDLCLSMNIPVHVRWGKYADGRKNDQRANLSRPYTESLEYTHFERNRMIVYDCELLLATPWQMEESTKGGTWYTINHAKKSKVQTMIFWREKQREPTGAATKFFDFSNEPDDQD